MFSPLHPIEELGASLPPPPLPPLEIPEIPRQYIFMALAAIIPAILQELLSSFLRKLNRRPHPRRHPRPTYIATTTDAAVVTPPTLSTPRYGLALGEVHSDDESDEEVEDDLTARELRRLEQSPAFHAWLQAQNLTTHDLESTESTLRLYSKLKDLHPSSFWLLCRPDTLTALETTPASAVLRVFEYSLSQCINIAIVVMIWRLFFLAMPPPSEAPILEGIMCSIAVSVFWARAWLNGRPCGGSACSVWYEEMKWGHRASAVRAVLANVLEVVYVVGTIGTGAIVSLVMRWKGGQSVGEKIAGVRIVVEKKIRLDHL